MCPKIDFPVILVSAPVLLGLIWNWVGRRGVWALWVWGQGLTIYRNRYCTRCPPKKDLLMGQTWSRPGTWTWAWQQELCSMLSSCRNRYDNLCQVLCQGSKVIVGHFLGPEESWYIPCIFLYSWAVGGAVIVHCPPVHPKTYPYRLEVFIYIKMLQNWISF